MTNRSSAQIINATASPVVLNAASIAKGQVYCSGALIEVAAADVDTDVFRFFRLPSHAIIHSLQVTNDAITAGTVYDIGLYQTVENGSAEADANLFANDVDMSSARITPLEALTVTLNIDKVGQTLWQLLALTSDPQREYDVSMLASTVGTAAGTIVLRAYWSAG